MVSEVAVTYPYADGNLLDRRHNYFYSAYLGPAFLDAWRESRQAAAAIAMQANADAHTNADAPSPTEQTLRSLLCAFHRGQPDAPAWHALDRHIQRFEVSKRIHAAYHPDYKPIDPEAYRDLGLYILFAEVLVCAAGTSHRLSYLSALLKCMDIVAAYAGRLSAAQSARFAALVDAEQHLVRDLEVALGEGAAC